MARLDDKRKQREADALEQVRLADAAEAHRVFWWGLLSRTDKARALMVAGLDARRARDALSSFNPEERALIYGMIQAHISKMEVIQKIMCLSGSLPEPVVAPLNPAKLH